MERYNFAVLQDDVLIAAAWSIAVPGLNALWPRVVALAKTFGAPGGRIRVTDKAGDVVMLIEVDAVWRTLANMDSTSPAIPRASHMTSAPKNAREFELALDQQQA